MDAVDSVTNIDKIDDILTGIKDNNIIADKIITALNPVVKKGKGKGAKVKGAPD